MFLFSNKMKSSCLQAEDQARTCSWNVNVFQPLHSVVALINFALTKKVLIQRRIQSPVKYLRRSFFQVFNSFFNFL